MKNDRQQQFALAVSAAFGVGIALLLASRNKSVARTSSALAEAAPASQGLFGELKHAATQTAENLFNANMRFTNVLQKVVRVI